MARAKNGGKGRVDRLHEAMASLVQAQAALVQSHALLEQAQVAFLSRQAETNRENAERFARVEAILMEHSRILRALPDTIRDKIGFKTPP
jgi:hypothetical protein